MKTVIPVGPYHPLMREPEYFRFHCEGEKILGVEVNIGYQHRGIEKIIEGRSPVEGMRIVERICGICSHAHSFAYVRTMESLANFTPPHDAAIVRGLVAELERIHSHLLNIGLLAEAIGQRMVFMHVFEKREFILRILEELSGKRIQYGVNKLGGVRFGIKNKAMVEKVASDILEYSKRLEKIFQEKTISLRLKERAPIGKELAKRYGLVGPVARASGVSFDVRSFGYDGYGLIDFEPVVLDDGDALSRTLVRIREVGRSCQMIKAWLELYKGGPLEENFVLRDGLGIGRVEAPRGEDVHVSIIESGIIKRHKIRPPTFINLQILPEICEGHQIADIPVILLSLDPCFACNDRTVVITKEGKRRFDGKWRLI